MIRDLYFGFFLPISCFVIAVFYFEEPDPLICWKTLCFILKNQIQGFVKNSGVFIYAYVLLKIWSNGLCGLVVKYLEHLFMPAFARSGTFTIMPTFYKDLQQILYAHILSELCHSCLRFCKISKLIDSDLILYRSRNRFTYLFPATWLYIWIENGSLLPCNLFMHSDLEISYCIHLDMKDDLLIAKILVFL